MAKYRLVLVDRPAWFQPAIEQEEMARIGGEALVGWARLGEPPVLDAVNASTGLPVDELSQISISYVDSAKHTPEVIERMAADADAVMVTSAKITAEAMDRLPRLRAIGRPGIGYDVIDVPAATERGIAVFSSPGFCASEVADHTLMLALGLARKLPLLHHAIRRGVYERGLSAPMPAVYELTLGLVAFGEIARQVALRAKPFGFRLLASDPFVSQEVASQYGVTLVPIDDLLRQADIVSVHAPLMKETFHLLSEREFNLMKRTAYVINTARGPVIDQQALIAALRAGRIAGAGLDVFESEPLAADNPLTTMDNVLLTPHTAGVSDSSQIASRHRTARNIVNALVGEWPPTRDLVNPQVKENLRRAEPA
ncbi:MAG: C-terminal binding protein [Chloroflexi bacterium]|nr:C-terminal binding protein [Chloroflexota bacterium]MCL5110949.1 C-terminal binding protein [Chloroflexota bacterium]